MVLVLQEARGKGGKVLLFCEGTECRMSSFFALAHMHSFDDNNLGRLYTMYCDLHNMPGVEPPTLPEVHKVSCSGKAAWPSLLVHDVHTKSHTDNLLAYGIRVKEGNLVNLPRAHTIEWVASKVC